MLEPKPVRQSQTTMSRIMLPEDANPAGNVHGGIIMKFIDEAGGVASMRHARRRSVTVRFDNIDLKVPVYVGDLVTAYATVNDVGRTSMEVGVRVEAERPLTGEVVHVSSAYLVYVALDDHSKPVAGPPLLVETEDERRRQQEARFRREHRLRGERALEAWRARRARYIPALLRPPAGPPLVIGHRGASGHAPENTFASFELAVQMGVDSIELDIHPCRDGRLVVIHDATVDRTTNGHGIVCRMTVEQLKALDAGSWFGSQFAGERIPLLSEVLDWARGRIRLAIEVKQGPAPYAGIERQILDELTNHRTLEGAIAISFDHLLLRRLKELNPVVATGTLYFASLTDATNTARAALADVLLPHHSFVTDDVIAEAHAAGIGVYTWTADEPHDLHRLLQTGIDGIATNYPDRLRALITQEQVGSHANSV